MTSWRSAGLVQVGLIVTSGGRIWTVGRGWRDDGELSLDVLTALNAVAGLNAVHGMYVARNVVDVGVAGGPAGCSAAG